MPFRLVPKSIVCDLTDEEINDPHKRQNSANKAKASSYSVSEISQHLSKNSKRISQIRPHPDMQLVAVQQVDVHLLHVYAIKSCCRLVATSCMLLSTKNCTCRQVAQRWTCSTFCNLLRRLSTSCTCLDACRQKVDSSLIFINHVSLQPEVIAADVCTLH